MEREMDRQISAASAVVRALVGHGEFTSIYQSLFVGWMAGWMAGWMDDLIKEGH